MGWRFAHMVVMRAIFDRKFMFTNTQDYPADFFAAIVSNPMKILNAPSTGMPSNENWCAILGSNQ